MKEMGIALIFIAAIVGYLAFNMDISVSASSLSGNYGSNNFGTDRVANLGLMNDQQNLFNISSALGIMGSILFVGGAIEKKMVSLRPDLDHATSPQISTPNIFNDSNLTPKQKELKAKYERSEISFEDYTKEWNKL